MDFLSSLFPISLFKFFSLFSDFILMLLVFIIACVSIYQLIESFIPRSEYHKQLLDILNKIYEKL